MPLPMGVLSDLEQYQHRGEAFLAELGRAWYRNGAGHTAELPLADIYERYADLFTAEGAQELIAAMAEATGDTLRSRRNLAVFAVAGAIEQACRADAQAVVEAESTATVQIDGDPVAYRSVGTLVANEPDAERRAALDAKRMRVLDDQLNPIYADLWDRRHRTAQALDGGSYRDLFAKIGGVDLPALAAQGERLLAETEQLYEHALDASLRRHAGIKLGGATAADLPRVFRANEFDERFTEKAMLPALRQTLDGLGIDMSKQANVVLDMDARPGKDTRAFCVTARIPEEIYLVMAPAGGLDDYSALFHESGHVQHFAGMGASRPFEFRHLGDNAVTETFAFLFEGLLRDPVWLEWAVGGRDHDGLRRHTATTRLYQHRRYAAKLGYELDFHAAEIGSLQDRYTDTLEAASRVKWPSARHLEDIDEGFYAAAYLRAWALECGLRAQLRDQFGTKWFTSRKAGMYLREIWDDGQRLLADELASELDLPPLDLTILVEEAHLELG
jgi:hypothetical protein